MNPDEIVQAWALACCETLESRDVDAHMGLISKQVRVYGLADHEFVDHKFWRQQVEEQFAQGLVRSLRYYLGAVRADSDTQITFTAIEYLTDAEGQEHANSLVVQLNQEADGVWRATQEKILTDEQAREAGLTPAH